MRRVLILLLACAACTSAPPGAPRGGPPPAGPQSGRSDAQPSGSMSWPATGPGAAPTAGSVDGGVPAGDRPMCAAARVRCLSPAEAAAWWPADALLRPAPGVPHTYVGTTARGGYGPGEASAANGSALWLVLADPGAGPRELPHGRLPAAGAILVHAVLMPPDGSPAPAPPGARTILVRGRPATVGTGRQSGVEGEIRVVAYDEFGAGRRIYWNVLDSPARRTEAELVRTVDALGRTSG